MTSRPRPVAVVKLGGSLLDWPAWPSRLVAFLATCSHVAPVLVVGGGRFADVLRDLDQIHALGEAHAHALALRVLDTTAHLAAALLPASVVVTEIGRLDRIWDNGLIPIFAPRHFLDKIDSPSADPLPATWATTTDSIAARLATRLDAAELILLKSCPLLSPITDWLAAAQLGLVDPEFPALAAKLSRVRFIDLRNNDT